MFTNSNQVAVSYLTVIMNMNEVDDLRNFGKRYPICALLWMW